MIVYRHRNLMTHPDLAGWTPREESTVALCHQLRGEWNYCAVAEPILFTLPDDDAPWRKISGDWEVVYVPNAGGVVPGRDLSRLNSWAPAVLPILDAKGAHWLGPIILTTDGDRAFPVRYAGPDFLPDLTPEQVRAETIAREARSSFLSAQSQAVAGDQAAGIPTKAACRWVSIFIEIAHHVGAETIAACGILDDVLIRSGIICGSGLDRRADGEV